MRLGAYVAQLAAGLAGGRGLRRRRSCPSATGTATSSTPGSAPGSRTPASGARARRPTVAWSSSSSCRATRSGSARRRTPSSRAVPTRPAPLFREFIGAALARVPRAATRTCSTSTSAESRLRHRVSGARLMAGFTKRGETVVHEGFRDHAWPSPSSRRPTARRIERDVVHHPGAVAVVPLHDDGTVMLVSPVPRRRSTTTCSRSRPASATSPASPEVTAANRELVEEVGLHAGRSSTWSSLPQLAGLLRRGGLRLPRHRARPRSTHGREGTEEEDMIDRARAPGRRAGHGRRRADHRRQVDHRPAR